MHRLHVLRQATQAQPQHPRGQVRHRVRRQDDKARVVGDQMQAPELLLRAPADPAVARGQLERARLPADEREPGRAQGRDRAQTLAEHAMKRQVVMARHQTVPAPVFLRAPGRAHPDRTQINGAIRCRQRSHDRYTATSKTQWSAPGSAGAASPTRRTNNKIALELHAASCTALRILLQNARISHRCFANNKSLFPHRANALRKTPEICACRRACGATPSGHGTVAFPMLSTNTTSPAASTSTIMTRQSSWSCVAPITVSDLPYNSAPCGSSAPFLRRHRQSRRWFSMRSLDSSPRRPRRLSTSTGADVNAGAMSL